jgi:hypothetical protein
MERIRVLPLSATKTVAPVVSVTTSCGMEKVAADPAPLALPLAAPFVLPPPASVITAAVASARVRIRWLSWSAM